MEPRRAKKYLTVGDLIEFEAAEFLDSLGENPPTLNEHYLADLRQWVIIAASLQKADNKTNLNRYVSPAGVPWARMKVKDWKPPTEEEIRRRKERAQEQQIAGVRGIQRAAKRKREQREQQKKIAESKKNPAENDQ